MYVQSNNHSFQPEKHTKCSIIFFFFIGIITTKITFRNYKYQTSKKDYCITTMYVLTITVTRKNKERTLHSKNYLHAVL